MRFIPSSTGPTQWICSAAIISSLAACAPMQRYVPPTSGATAKLIIRDAILPNEVIGVFSFADPYKCQNPSEIGEAKPGKPIRTVDIAANGLVTVQALISRPPRLSCNVKLSFRPKGGRHYLLATYSSATGCSAIIYDATNPDALAVEPTAVIRNTAQAGCLPLEQSLSLRKRTADAKIDDEFPSQRLRSGAHSTPQSSDSLDDFNALLKR